jgi:hypothetical protein
MDVSTLKRAATLVAVAVALTLSGNGIATAEEFDNPRVDGHLLDGCYRWPGQCNSRRQANEFCRRMDFEEAIDWQTRAGAANTKRLGDGGTCIAFCTVMTYVECE